MTNCVRVGQIYHDADPRCPMTDKVVLEVREFRFPCGRLKAGKAYARVKSTYGGERWIRCDRLLSKRYGLVFDSGGEGFPESMIPVVVGGESGSERVKKEWGEDKKQVQAGSR